MQQIIAMGGGGFSMEPNNQVLDRYILDQSGVEKPKVCFLAQASAESPDYILRFYKAFMALSAQPTDLSLFRPHTADIEDFLLSQHVIYVGGGNTKSMLALWREWGLDGILLRALRNGVLLAGLSAGAICWFEQSTTDAIPGDLSVLAALGYIKGSCSPHYSEEPERRPTYHRLIQSGVLSPGYGIDTFAAIHFIDGKLHQAVSSRPDAKVYFVEPGNGEAQETFLETRCLSRVGAS